MIVRMKTLVNQKLASWMAIFAILFAFFAPQISQAMAGDEHANLTYQQVCTEQGSKLIPFQIPSDKHQDGVLSHGGMCAFCLSSAHTPIINKVFPEFFAAPALPQKWNVAFYQSPITQSLHQLSYSPQAPPSI